MVRDLWNWFLDLLYPPKCTFCHEILSEEERVDRICAKCRGELQPQMLTISHSYIEEGMSIFAYGGKVRKSLHRFKFNGRKEYASVYARLLASAAAQADWMAEIDVVTAVPTNRRNERKRGYNHAALLAECTARELGLNYLTMLKKVRETDSMYGLRSDQRRKNIQGAIKVCCEREQIAGKTVLLIDDIFTTGVTVEECAAQLYISGAVKVCVLTVAKTVKS